MQNSQNNRVLAIIAAVAALGVVLWAANGAYEEQRQTADFIRKSEAESVRLQNEADLAIKYGDRLRH